MSLLAPRLLSASPKPPRAPLPALGGPSSFSPTSCETPRAHPLRGIAARPSPTAGAPPPIPPAAHRLRGSSTELVPDPRAEKRLGAEASGSPEGPRGMDPHPACADDLRRQSAGPCGFGVSMQGTRRLTSPAARHPPQLRRARHQTEDRSAPGDGPHLLERRAPPPCEEPPTRGIPRVAACPKIHMAEQDWSALLGRDSDQAHRAAVAEEDRRSSSGRPETRHPLRWPGERDYKAQPLRPDAGDRVSNRSAGCARRYLQLERG